MGYNALNICEIVAAFSLGESDISWRWIFYCHSCTTGRSRCSLSATLFHWMKIKLIIIPIGWNIPTGFDGIPNSKTEEYGYPRWMHDTAQWSFQDLFAQWSRWDECFRRVSEKWVNLYFTLLKSACHACSWSRVNDIILFIFHERDRLDGDRRFDDSHSCVLHQFSMVYLDSILSIFHLSNWTFFEIAILIPILLTRPWLQIYCGRTWKWLNLATWSKKKSLIFEFKWKLMY